VLKPIIEAITIKLPSLVLGTVGSGVVGGIGGVLGNMIFATNAGVGADVIPLPTMHATEDAAEDDDTCPPPPPPTSSTEEHDQRNKEQIKGGIDELMDKEAEILKDYPDQPLGRTRGRIEKWLKDFTKR
jgi:hypothetical protein